MKKMVKIEPFMDDGTKGWRGRVYRRTKIYFSLFYKTHVTSIRPSAYKNIHFFNFITSILRDYVVLSHLIQRTPRMLVMVNRNVNTSHVDYVSLIDRIMEW